MSDSWFAPVCAYCERADATFWAEPLNALSNLAFLAAAFAATRKAHRDPAVRALAATVAVVGIGSFLFHTLANRWSLVADVVPIAVFIHAYFLLAMRRLLGLGLVAAVAATLGFAAFNAGFEPMLDALAGRSLDGPTNGSLAYLPAILALLGVGAAMLGRGGRVRGPAVSVLAAAGAFAVSLGVRTADCAVCASLPTGTHFLWHLLNAGVLYVLMATAARVGRQPA